jgi:fumarate hydratase class II
MSGSRIEKDSFGPIEVPADRLWGAQTERSRRFFRISGERMPLAVLHALTTRSSRWSSGRPARARKAT